MARMRDPVMAGKFSPPAGIAVVAITFQSVTTSARAGAPASAKLKIVVKDRRIVASLLICIDVLLFEMLMV
jgi:hypothetical protein